ncbi:MAG: carbamoyltransferase [Eubacterium sp.]|nr:carbamoyltransferase [Eubacterium sp.]
MYILGVSALYHDSAAAIIKDGVVVAAAQEERFSRIKHDRSIPGQAIAYCMREAGGLKGEELEAVVYYDDPILTLQRFLANVSAAEEDAEDLIRFGSESVFGKKLWIEKLLRDQLGVLGKEDCLYVTRHHLSHAASAFFPSPFEHAAILTVDGVGEWNTTTIGRGKGRTIDLIKSIDYPHSLGLLYSAFTWFCGFRVNYGDYKLMGLAPYGEPVYRDVIKEELIHIKEDGSFRLNLKYFDYPFGRTMTNEAFAGLFGERRRMPEEQITRREMDLAASVQAVTEEVLMKLAGTARNLTGEKNLVMAGGVALNCVANGKLLKTGLFDQIWIQPAAGDAGGALGAALSFYHMYKKMPRERTEDDRPAADRQKGSLLGPAFSEEEIREYLAGKQVPYHVFEKRDIRNETIAGLLEAQKVIGLFQGRMEFGPRALGNRSILADPRSEKMQAHLNRKIKKRESFRPFAPAVLEERCRDYFELRTPSPYMLFCGNVRNREDETYDIRNHLQEDPDMLPVIQRRRSAIPAVTHVDYSARIQTVNQNTNPAFYGILKAFEKRTGCGVVINTSFNVRGEPIVCTPDDAYRCFMNTDMDVLVMEQCILYKEEQPESERRQDVFELD